MFERPREAKAPTSRPILRHDTATHHARLHGAFAISGAVKELAVEIMQETPRVPPSGKASHEAAGSISARAISSRPITRTGSRVLAGPATSSPIKDRLCRSQKQTSATPTTRTYDWQFASPRQFSRSLVLHESFRACNECKEGASERIRQLLAAKTQLIDQTPPPNGFNTSTLHSQMWVSTPRSLHINMPRMYGYPAVQSTCSSVSVQPGSRSGGST